jgi:hypothetical protein
MKHAIALLCLGAALVCSLALAASEKAAPAAITAIYRLDDVGAVEPVTRAFMAGKLPEDLKRVTVIGYVTRPGIYLFKDKASFLDLLKAAGELRLADGERSASTFVVLDGTRSRTVSYNVLMLNAEAGKATDEASFARGGEVIFRQGMLGL